MFMISNRKLPIFIASALLFTGCAWSEGFVNNDTLYLIGEGRVPTGTAQLQAGAMAREAAVIEAMSHLPNYCPIVTDVGATSNFTMPPQTKREFECNMSECRARVTLQKKNLEKLCAKTG
jgi:hypothetical protein